MKTIKNATAQTRIIFLPSGNLKIEPGKSVSVTTDQANELAKFFKTNSGKALVDGKFLLIDSNADIQTQQETPCPPSDLSNTVNKGSAEASANTEMKIDPKADKKIKLDGVIQQK